MRLYPQFRHQEVNKKHMFDLASKYGFSLDKNSEKAMRCFLLLYNLEKYVNGAIIEMNRLNRVRQAVNESVRNIELRNRRRNYQLTYLANDTHFYFVCIDKVYKLLFKLAQELNDMDIKKLAQNLGKTFDIRTVRNHLEHIDTRCLGFLSEKDEKNKVRKHISDFGNFIGENFSFDRKTYPSGKGSLIELKKIYIDLIEILDRKYASKDPGFIWRQNSEKVYKKIMQNLKKANWFQKLEPKTS